MKDKALAKARYLRRYARHAPTPRRVRHYQLPQPPVGRLPELTASDGSRYRFAFDFSFLAKLFIPHKPRSMVKQAALKAIGVGRGGIKMYREIAAPQRGKDYPRKSQ